MISPNCQCHRSSDDVETRESTDSDGRKQRSHTCSVCGKTKVERVRPAPAAG